MARLSGRYCNISLTTGFTQDCVLGILVVFTLINGMGYNVIYNLYYIYMVSYDETEGFPGK